jgi:hypothetical protein
MRDSVVFYRSFMEAIECLSDQDQLEAFRAIVKYGLNGEEPEGKGVAAAIFMIAKPLIDRNVKRYEAGKTGGRPARRDNPAATTVPVEQENLEPLPVDREEPTRNQAEPTCENPKPNHNQTEPNCENQEPNVNVNVDVDVNVEGEPPPTPSRGEAVAVPYTKIMQLYNETCTSLPHIRIIDGQRKKAVAARWRAYHGLDDFRRLFQRAQASDFLRGGGERNWIADFDWLMKPTNMARVLEGKYDNERSGYHGTDQQHPGWEGVQQPPPPIRLTGFHLAGD